MFKELDTVKLTHGIKKHGLAEGDLGAIVHIYGKGKAYEVEFINSDGRTKALLTLMPNDIRLLSFLVGYNVYPNTPLAASKAYKMVINPNYNHENLRLRTETRRSEENTKQFRYSVTI